MTSRPIILFMSALAWAALVPNLMLLHAQDVGGRGASRDDGSLDAGSSDPEDADGGAEPAQAGAGAPAVAGSGGAAPKAAGSGAPKVTSVKDLHLPKQSCSMVGPARAGAAAHGGWLAGLLWLWLWLMRSRARRRLRASALKASRQPRVRSTPTRRPGVRVACRCAGAWLLLSLLLEARTLAQSPGAPAPTTPSGSTDTAAQGTKPSGVDAQTPERPAPANEASDAEPPASLAVDATPASARSEESTLGTVIVTGVRGGPPRTVAESPAPIDIVSAEELKKTGRAELGEALAKVLPSLTFSNNQAGITSIVRPVSNRGLGPAYTLILVNGKRRHNGAQVSNSTGDTSGNNAVDLDMIPISAVDYIEVLKDSAAAQYGSDAVAGVINVVLKKDPEGGRISVTGGRLYGGHGNLDSGRAEADFGLRLGQRGVLHIGADARFRGQAHWNFPATQGPYAPADNPKNAAWNRDGAHNGDPQVGAVNAFYNLDLPIADLRLYSFGTVGSRWTEAGNNLRRPDGLANFSDIYPDGYFPLSNTAELDFQVVAGVKGELAGAKLDLSTSYGRSNVRQYSNLAINPSLGPTSPRSFDELATYRFQQWIQNLDLTKGFDVGLPQPLQVSLGAEFRVDTFSTFAGDRLGYTNGGYRFAPGDQEGDPNVGKLASPGAQGAVVLRPSDEVRLRRNVLAGYVDLGLYPIKAWYNGLAARVEHYNDSSGTTVGGKYNTRLDIARGFALRGTVGTGFRAPSLTQIGYSQTDNRTNTNPLTGVTGPSLSVLPQTEAPLARALGAKDLKPERSTNFALGTVLQPFERLNITIDAYQISIKDRIGRTDSLLGPAIAPILTDNNYTGTEFVRYFANQADTRTRGVDVVVDWGSSLGTAGSLNLSAAFNYNRTEITRIAATPAELTRLPAGPDSNLVFFGRTTGGELSVNLPTNKLILGGRWRKGPVRLGATLTRYGSYNFVRSQMVQQDVHYGPKALFDVDLTLTLFRTLDLTLGAINIFDVRPDANGVIDPTTGAAAQVYGPAPFAPSGGFYYVKLQYNL